MATLNTLRNVLLKLKKEEIRSLTDFLKYHQRDSSEKPMKSVQLVEMLLEGKNYTSNELQLTLYGRINYNAFNKLINRLKDKIYEIILFDNNLEKTVSAKRNRVIFDIRKKLLQCEVMFSRGINDELESIQNKVIHKAKQYEVYDSLLEALHAKQRYLGFRFGAVGHRKLKDEIKFYEYNRIASLRAREIFSGITAKINFSNSSDEYQFELNDAIKILEDDFEKTKSATIGYFYFFLQTEKFQSLNSLDSAQKVLTHLKKLLEGNPAVYTENRMGAALLNIAINELLMFDFEASTNSINEAVPYFSVVNINAQLAREIEFYNLFYLTRFKEAEQVISELYHASRTSQTPFLYSKRAFLFACIMTLNGKYTQSKELLSEVSEIEKDKEGWNIGKRILMIINRIESKEFESVDLHVQNLQRHIKRTLKTKIVRKRNVLILRLLLKLINEKFDFKKVFKSRQRYFELLESNYPEYCWKIKSPELIIFHEWFKSKAENRPYNHSVALLEEKQKYILASKSTENELVLNPPFNTYRI